MTPTPTSSPSPADATDLREALAGACYEISNRGRRSPPWSALNKGAAWDRNIRIKAFLAADALIAGPLAPILDRITAAEAAREELQALLVTQEICADRLTAELAEARAALEASEKKAKNEKDSADMYARAWVRELGGKLFNKTHHIDACVMTTRWMKERSDRLAVIEADQKAAALVAEYGPSNGMIAARRALTATGGNDVGC